MDADIVYQFTTPTSAFTQGMLHEKADFSSLPTIRVYDGVFTFVMDSSDALFGTLSGNHHLLNATDFDIDFNVHYNGEQVSSPEPTAAEQPSAPGLSPPRLPPSRTFTGKAISRPSLNQVRWLMAVCWYSAVDC